MSIGFLSVSNFAREWRAANLAPLCRQRETATNRPWHVRCNGLARTLITQLMTHYITPYGAQTRALQLAPFHAGFASRSRWINQLLSDSLSDWLGDSGQLGLSYDEKEGIYTATLDLPGYKREEINVEVSDGHVIVTAENKRRGRVAQSWYVSDVDTGKIDAKLEDGTLTLSLPKVPEALPKRVEVR